MKYAPNLNRIVHIMSAWQHGVLSLEEVTEGINRTLSPENHIPGTELVPDPDPAEETASLRIRLTRVEAKLDAIIRHQQVPLPPEIDPNHVPDDVKELARTNKIMAVKMHRERTGVGLAQAKEAIDRSLLEDEGMP